MELDKLFKEYSIAAENLYLNDIYNNQDLVTESIISSIKGMGKAIIELIKNILDYIKNLHPIKRKIINTLLTKLKNKTSEPYTDKLYQLLDTSDSGLMFVCNHDLYNVAKLEAAIFELYYHTGTTPNLNNTIPSLYLNFNLNNKIISYITEKVREWCRTSNVSYVKHQIVCINTRGSIVYITVTIYDNQNKYYVEDFKFIVPEDDIKYDSIIDKSELKYIAQNLLNSHYKHLDKYRWITTQLNKNLSSNDSFSSEAKKIAENVLTCVNNMTQKFWVLATEVSKAAIGKK